MAGVRITFNSKQAGERLVRSVRRQAQVVRTSMRETADQAADRIELEGRDDIGRAGKFGSRWKDGWQAKVSEGGGNLRIRVTMAVAYWTVFQEGKVIFGKPLLWIPLSFASDAQGIRARDYPGPLFRVDRLGKAPLLMTPGKPAEAKYFGKESVTIPKKFHLLELLDKVAKDLPSMYRQNFNSNKDR